MPKEDLILTLAKVLVAAAWVDGELTHDEVNSMKDLLYHVPQLTTEQWASLQIYIEAPVDAAERERLVEDLRYAIASEEDRALALQTLEEMMSADGQVSEEEERVAADIRAAIESVDVGLLSRLVKGMTGRRSQVVAQAPNREDYLEDFIRNKVYYGIRRRLDLGEAELDLDEESLRRLSLAGGIMAQVAQANPDVSDAEVAVMVDALQSHWHLAPEQATFVAGVALSETANLLDPYRLAWQFAEVYGYPQRVEFLDVLFAVAAADGKATYQEIEQIREISQSLKVSHQEFIAAKLKIPRSQRGE
jgi:uncharacterized tellurite resistance protein B-like protein